MAAQAVGFGLSVACLLSSAEGVSRTGLRGHSAFGAERMSTHGEAVARAVHGRMRPDVVAGLFSTVAHDWVQTRRQSLAASGADADVALNKVVKSCTKVSSAIVNAASGDETKVSSYMQTVCSQHKLAEADAKLCKALGEGLMQAMKGDSMFNEEVNWAAFCSSFYTGALTTQANEKGPLRLEPVASPRKAESAVNATQAKIGLPKAPAQPQSKQVDVAAPMAPAAAALKLHVAKSPEKPESIGTIAAKPHVAVPIAAAAKLHAAKSPQKPDAIGAMAAKKPHVAATPAPKLQSTRTKRNTTVVAATAAAPPATVVNAKADLTKGSLASNAWAALNVLNASRIGEQVEGAIGLSKIEKTAEDTWNWFVTVAASLKPAGPVAHVANASQVRSNHTALTKSHAKSKADAKAPLVPLNHSVPNSSTVLKVQPKHVAVNRSVAKLNASAKAPIVTMVGAIAETAAQAMNASQVHLNHTSSDKNMTKKARAKAPIVTMVVGAVPDSVAQAVNLSKSKPTETRRLNATLKVDHVASSQVAAAGNTSVVAKKQ